MRLMMKTFKNFLVLVTFIISFSYTNQNAQGKYYNIGDRGPAGGWIFYDKGDSTDGWRYLEAAPEDQSSGSQWGCHKKSIPGAKGTAIGTGKSNTKAIIKRCGEANRAAKLCALYRGGGKSDWFLPSKEELNLMYENLHKEGSGDFANDNYWSSSEDDAEFVWHQSFINGTHYFATKHYSMYVRAIRAFSN